MTGEAPVLSYNHQGVNLLVPGGFDKKKRYVIFTLILVIDATNIKDCN